MTGPIEPNSKKNRDFISRFKILSVLGEGGMGKVYKAHDPSLNQVFALKVLNANEISEQHHIRFQKEAKTLKALKHQAFPEIFNFAISREGDPYLVMEYIDGQSLRDILEQDQALELPEITDIILQICDALSYAHSNGIVHRDIKPDNIVITKSQEDTIAVKLIDFGISKLEDSVRAGQDMTQTGVIIGSPPYINPEQIRGEDTTAQSDLYSLGCVFFELLAGEPPFLGNNALKTLSMHLEIPVEDVLQKLPDNLPSGYLHVLESCLAKTKEDRYQSAKELADALKTLQKAASCPEANQNIIEVEQFQKTSNKSLFLPVALCLGIVAAASLIIPNLFDKEEEDPPPITSQEKSKSRPEDVSVFLTTLVSGADKPRDWQFMKMDNSKYWRGGEEIRDSDFEKLQKVKLGKDAFIRCEFSDHVTGSGVKYLKGLPIAGVIIASKKLNNDYFKYLKFIPTLKIVACGQAQDITIKGYKELKESKNLEGIGLKNLTLPDGAIHELEQLKKLKRFRLDGSSNISRDQLVSLSKIPNLDELHLDGSDANLEDLIVLNSSRSLKHLSLRALYITDGHTRILTKLKVNTLDLSGNGITDIGLIELAKNKNLKEIIISDYKTSKHTIEKFKTINKNCRLNFNIVRPSPHEV